MSDFLSMTAAQVEALPPDEAKAALAAWVKARRVELPEALSDSPNRAVAKLAKRALYQLRSEGLEVKPPEPKPSPIERQTPTASTLPAVLSPIVGTGERAILFATPSRGGGIDIFQGIISDEFGLVQFGSGHTNRSIYRARLRELEQDGALKVLQVSLQRMRDELGRAISVNERSGTRIPDDWADALRKAGVTALPADVDVPPLEPGDDAQTERDAALHDEPELLQWMPGEAQLAQLAEKAEAARSLPDDARHTQLREAAVALAREFLTPERRRLYGRRLWYTAELFEGTGRPDAATLARREARRLFHGDGPSAFMERLFTRAAEKSGAAAPTVAPDAPAR